MGKYDDKDWAELPAEVQQAGELYIDCMHSACRFACRYIIVSFQIITHLVSSTHTISNANLFYESYHCYSFIIECTSYQLPLSDTTRVSGIKTTNPTHAMSTGRIWHQHNNKLLPSWVTTRSLGTSLKGKRKYLSRCYTSGEVHWITRIFLSISDA